MIKGKLSIVGIGPGSKDHMTPSALNAIREAEVVAGYTTYIDLVKEVIAGKELISTGMTREIERCRAAVETAEGGRKVALICSGDPGIYAMAGLVFEILRRQKAEDRGQRTEDELDLEIIPGIPALASCASKLGAPLMHDFALISLSDRLTPWDVIEKRVGAAAAADFVIVFYNPRSRGRKDHLEKAVDIILQHRDGMTPVGVVKSAERKEEKVIVTTLSSIPYEEVDMQSTVIIGNTNTYIWGDRIVTPRGYEDKYAL